MYKLLLGFFWCCIFSSALSAQNFGIEFDGVDDKITLCHSDNFNIGDGFTVEAWINAYEWRPEQWRGSIVNKDQHMNGGVPEGFALRAGDNGVLSFVMAASDDWREIATSPIMNENQWHHVAAVVDGNDFSLYIDGQLEASGDFPGTPNSNITPLTLGWSPGFGDRGWNGAIDEVRIWNIARSPEELSANMTVALNGDETGLVAYLPMNEGSGLSVENILGCNGSLNGMTEEAWTDGFFIPTADIGVSQILAPDVLSIYQRPVKVSVEIKNYGSEPVSDFQIRVNNNGNNILSETYNGTLQPEETMVYTFETPYYFGDGSPHQLEVKTDFADDSNIQNNGISMEYIRPESGLIVNVFDVEQHNFGNAGQNQYRDMILPLHSEDFEQILLHFRVDCPSTGCDPWDQPAAFYLDTPEGSYELARYITPYGKDCGPWTIDITDFKSVLRGPVTIRSFIQVWGNSGWLVTADLQFIETETPVYQKLQSLWETNNWVYGDPDISYDLPEQSLEIADNTDMAHMRMTITGHGQGNTDNAAEFSEKTHTIHVNGSASATHFLWKDNCEFNSCSDQFGTWLFDRAGWCPGQEVTPLLHNLNGDITPGTPITIDYELETYTNLLNTGYDGQGHTEPHYKIFAYLVETSAEHFTQLNNLRADSLLIITNGDINNPIFEGVALRIKNTGTESIAGATASYLVNGQFVVEEPITETIAPGQEYTHEFATIDGFTGGISNRVIAFLRAAEDENISDDAYTIRVEADLSVGTLEPEVTTYKIYPNPATEWITVETDQQFLDGLIQVFDLQGRMITQQPIRSDTMEILLAEQGLFLIVLQTADGHRVTEKVVRL